MPEGPEIRRAADRLGRVLANETIEAAYFFHKHLHNYANALQGRTVTAVTPASKAMLTHFDCDLTMYSHNQLYGRWYVCRRGKLPETNRSLRAALHTKEASALLYSASDIDIIPTSQLNAHPYLAKLGPEALDANTSVATITQRLSDKRFAGRSLSSLLLDQSFVAGLGNYLRTEILFFAGIHPGTKPGQLSAAKRTELAKCILEITRRAYQTAGITNVPGRVKTLRKKGTKRSELRFAAFARAGKRCYDCNEVIARSEMQSRRIYICNRCQMPA